MSPVRVLSLMVSSMMKRVAAECARRRLEICSSILAPCQGPTRTAQSGVLLAHTGSVKSPLGSEGRDV